MFARTDKENTPNAAELRSRSARAKRSGPHNTSRAKQKINFIERNRLAAASSAPAASKVNAHGRGRGLSERDGGKVAKAKVKSSVKTDAHGRSSKLPPTKSFPAAADSVASRTRSRGVRTRKAAPPAAPPLPAPRAQSNVLPTSVTGTTRLSARLTAARDKAKVGKRTTKGRAGAAVAKGAGSKGRRHAASPGAAGVAAGVRARAGRSGGKAAQQSTPKAARRSAPAGRLGGKSPLVDTVGVASSAADAAAASRISPQQKRALRTSPPKLAGDTLSVPVLAIDLMHEREECEAVMPHEQEEFVEDAGALADILGGGASDEDPAVEAEMEGQAEAEAQSGGEAEAELQIDGGAEAHVAADAVRPARARRARIRHAPLTPGSCRRTRPTGKTGAGTSRVANAADMPKCGLAAEIRREDGVGDDAPANAAGARSGTGVGARRAALRAGPRRNKLKFRKRLQEVESKEQEAAREEQRRGSIYAAPRRVARACGKSGKGGNPAAQSRGAPVVQLDVQLVRAKPDKQVVADARQQANAVRAASRGRIVSRNVRALQRSPESDTVVLADAEPALEVERDALDLLGDEADISNEMARPVTIVHTSPRQLCRTLARPLGVSPRGHSECEQQDRATALVGLGAPAFAEAIPEPPASPSRDELEEAETVGLRIRLSGHVVQDRFQRPLDPLAAAFLEEVGSDAEAEIEADAAHQGSEEGTILQDFTSDCCSAGTLTRSIPVARRVSAQGQVIAPSNGAAMHRFGAQIPMSEKLAQARAELESERSKNAAMGFGDAGEMHDEMPLNEREGSTLSAGMGLGLGSNQIGVASSWSSSCSGGSFGSGDFQTFALTALAQEKESEELVAEAQPLHSPSRRSAAEAIEAVEFSPSAPELQMALGSVDQAVAGRSPSRTDDLPRLFNPVATVLFGNQSPAAQQPQRAYGDNSPLQARVLSMSGDRNVTNPKATLCSAQVQQVAENDDDGEYNSDTFELDDTE